MRRLAAVAVMVAWFSVAAGAQRGGSHGGFSGSHGGSSGARGGFSAPAGGFSSHGGSTFHSAPGFHGGFSAPHSGFSRLAPPHYAGPVHYGPGSSPYSVRAPHPTGLAYSGSRMPYTGPRTPNTGSTHRMPYHSPNGSDHHDHDGNHYHDHDGNHHHVGVYWNSVWSGWGWGYPYYGWGYPYLLPSYLDYPDYNSDPQPDSYSAAQQPYSDYSNGPYEEPPDNQYEPQPRPSYTPWPYGTQPTPSQAELPSSPPVPEEPVTLVFKDGRPPQQIHNYLLTATTLSVLDQRRQDIPVDQIDLAATARVNRDAGVSFALPGGSR